MPLWTLRAGRYALIEAHPDFFPMYTQGGKWRHEGEAWTNWCEGFLGGQMWILYGHTGSPYWRRQAEHYRAWWNTARRIALCMTWAFCSGRRGNAGMT